MSEQLKLTDDDFYKKYKTIPNHIRPNENNEFETYGPEIEYIHEVLANDPSRLWTIIDNNDGWMGIVAGYHHINRMCYLVTEQAWERSDEEYTIYDTTELREQWNSLSAEAISKVTGVNVVGQGDEEMEIFRDDNFYQWEEMGEIERDKILEQYKKQINEKQTHEGATGNS